MLYLDQDGDLWASAGPDLVAMLDRDNQTRLDVGAWVHIISKADVDTGPCGPLVPLPLPGESAPPVEDSARLFPDPPELEEVERLNADQLARLAALEHVIECADPTGQARFSGSELQSLAAVAGWIVTGAPIPPESVGPRANSPSAALASLLTNPVRR